MSNAESDRGEGNVACETAGGRLIQEATKKIEHALNMSTSKRNFEKFLK